MIRSPLNGAAARRSTRYHHVISNHLRSRHFRRFVTKTPRRQGELSVLRNQLNKDITRQDAPRLSPSSLTVSDASAAGCKPEPEPNTAAHALKLPAFEEVPDALKACFRDGVLIDPGRIRNNPWVITNVQPRRSTKKGEDFPHRLHLSFYTEDSSKIEVIGKGKTRGMSDYDANLQLIAKLHECGLLQKIYARLDIERDHIKTIPGLIDISGLAGNVARQSLSGRQDEEISAIKITDSNNAQNNIGDFGITAFDEAYNACARIGRLPKVKIIPEPDILNPGLPTAYYTLFVELPGYNISVSVRGTRADSRLQEQVAFAEFNRKLQDSGLPRGSDPSRYQNPNSLLTLKNAEAFIRSIPDADISMRRKRKEIYHYYQIRVNGSTLGSGCSTSKQRASDVACLETAINMANMYPRLLKLYLDSSDPTSLEPATTTHPRQGTQDALTDIDRSWPIAVDLGANNIALLQKSLERADNLQRTINPERLEQYNNRKSKRIAARTLTPVEEEARSKRLLKSYRDYTTRPDMEETRLNKAKLPMIQQSERILKTVSKYPFTIIVGATGSGKTTQVPQIILDSFITSKKGGKCSIVCTQPRVMAATSVARRVAAERSQELGDQVGYQVRLDNIPTNIGGTISYCTTGILLRQLLYRPELIFDSVSHLILDEVHVRDTLIDLTLAVLKYAIQKRLAAHQKVPKVILMSATLQASSFSKYFHMNLPGRGLLKCPIIDVPGRAFPVKMFYLDTILPRMEDVHGTAAIHDIYRESTTRKYLESENRFGYMQLPAALREEDDMEPSEVEISRQDSQQVPLALVAATVAHIAATTKAGAILVFLPGFEVLTKVREMIQGRVAFKVDFQDKAKFRFYTLHSSLVKDQREVFDPVPEGCRKIILSTDIAEASVTIPEVQYVVDAGKHREFVYAQDSELETLEYNWISASSSKQRAGRAGRVQNGEYYALFPKRRPLNASGVPELLRADLQGACLAVRGYGIHDDMSIGEFLATTVTPPDDANVQAAISKLTSLGVLTDGEQITPMGNLLTVLPVPPRFGKLILLGIIYKCLDPMLILASSSQQHSFFSSMERTREQDKIRLEFGAKSSSDHNGLINAFGQARHLLVTEGPASMIHFADSSCINATAFTNVAAIAMQIERILERNGLIPSNEANREKQYGHPSLNENSGKESLIKALISSCLDIAVRKTPNLYRTRPWSDAVIHPGSTNQTVSHPRSQRPLWGTRKRILAYTSLAQTGNTWDKSAFLRDTTVIPPFAAAMFANTLELKPSGTNEVVVDGWVTLHIAGTNHDARRSGAATPAPEFAADSPNSTAMQLVKLHSALREMEADMYEVLKLKLSVARDNELKAELEAAERETQAVRDGLVRNVVEMLEQDELVVEMLALEQEVRIREELYFKQQSLLEEKRLADELRQQMMVVEEDKDEGSEEDGDEEDRDEEYGEEEDDDGEWTTIEYHTKQGPGHPDELTDLSQLVRDWRQAHDAGSNSGPWTHNHESTPHNGKTDAP